MPSSPSSLSPGPTLFTLPISRPPNMIGDPNTGTGTITVSLPRPSIYLLTFSNPPDNRLVTPFCQAFILALDILEEKYERGVLVTTSAIEKFYSNGMDVEHARWTAGYVKGSLYALWRRILVFSWPTVALINGHAFAGGLMTAMMHDYRVMNPHKGYLCLNEVELGAPLRPPMTAIFRMKLNGNVLRKLILEAYRFKALEALKEGLVDSLGGLDETLALIDELQLVKKAQPGTTGLSVLSELKEEMWRETIDLLEGWVEEDLREQRVGEKRRRDGEERRKRVAAWEGKAKL